MNTHTKVTMLGMFAGAAIVALASSGACNHSVQVDCATVGSICGGPSPNCTHLEANKYYGRVKSTTKRTRASSGGPGYMDWVASTNACTYVCEIIDCDNAPVEITITGGFNVVPAPGAVACN